MAGDASEGTKKKLRNMCDFYEVPFMEYADKDVLGRSIGKEMRAMVAITDEGLAKAVYERFKQLK